MTPPDTVATPAQGRPPGHRTKRWVLIAAVVAVLGLASWPVLNYFEVFSDKGDAISFGQDDKQGGERSGTSSSKASMPTGPKADFTVSGTVPEDGSKIAVTTYEGKKSGFKGKVWVWVPPQYKDPQYAKSGFPVLIALPGGSGYPNNYWMGPDLKLEASISKWSKEGKSLPFIVVMPVLNPEDHDRDPKDPKLGQYWDGSDIPGQPKMSTWLTEDVPDLVKENFRTVNSRDGWAFMGASTGGFAGLKSVLQKPDGFKAVIAAGPDIVPDSHLWKGHDQEKAENNPKALAPKLIKSGHPDVYLAFEVGTKETAAMPPIEDFVKSYTKGPIHTKLDVIQGGKHNAATYVPNMESAGLIQWISEHMQGPTPVS
ncbi:alpha/beta hydrolase [Streptomyces sp. NPDC050485]|uniref:alpha/beta hydrolase n=1 Tax=Streptomyces sp. NPDC050485 TaxID=3365617 RepID=UPI0037BA502E